MARASNLTMCSFCGKSHAEVRKLIAGPGVYICDSCINVCKSILDKELNEDARRQSSNIRVPKPAEIRRALDQYVIGQDTAKKTLSVAVHPVSRQAARSSARWCTLGAFSWLIVASRHTMTAASPRLNTIHTATSQSRGISVSGDRVTIAHGG